MRRRRTIPFDDLIVEAALIGDRLRIGMGRCESEAECDEVGAVPGDAADRPVELLAEMDA
jgi:hypothetical protein